MLSRHNEEAKGIDLPIEWLEEITSVVNSAYESLLSDKKLVLKTYGELHKGEVCLAFCLYKETPEDTTAISLLLSIDLKEKEDQRTCLITRLIKVQSFLTCF